MEVESILERIGLSNNREEFLPNIENLKTLQEAYILHVPYENLDFKFKRGFSVNILHIYKKIVENNRGGVCYESNTLFAYLLKSLGYDVQMIFAEVSDLSYIGAEYPHLALLVHMENRSYLVDVSNGQNVRYPLAIFDDTHIEESEDIIYKVIKVDNKYTLLFKKESMSDWDSRYHFETIERSVSDFSDILVGEEYLNYSNTAPLLATKALKNGRVTLIGDRLLLKENNKKREWAVTLENRAEILRDYFNINI